MAPEPNRGLLARGAALGLTAAALVAPAFGQAPTPIRLGAGMADTSSEAFYAIKLGLFKKYGLDVELQQMNSGAAEASAVAGGSLDIAESNVVSTAAAHLKGVAFVFIAPGAMYATEAPTTLFICAARSPLRTGKDFTGKTVGVVALRDLSALGPVAWIAQTGGDPTTIRYVEMPTSELVAAVQRGTVDAASVNEPFLHMALQQSDIRVVAKLMDAIAPHFMLNSWLTTRDWLQKNPAAAVAFRSAIIEAGRWANRNRPASAEIFKQYTRVAPDVIDTMKRAVFSERFDAGLFQPVIDSAAKYKFIDTRFAAAEIMAS